MSGNVSRVVLPPAEVNMNGMRFHFHRALLYARSNVKILQEIP